MEPLKSNEVGYFETKWYELLISMAQRRADGTPESRLKAETLLRLIGIPLVIAIIILFGTLFLEQFVSEKDLVVTFVRLFVLYGAAFPFFYTWIDSYNKASQRYLRNEAIYSADDIDGLAMHLPEDSRVKFDLLSGGQLIDSVRVSHYTASFVYFLGLERNAGEEYWLSSPDKHLDVLEKIFIDLDLDEIFEEELKLTSPPPPKNRKTWIWGFGTDKRRDTRNKIQGQITNLKTVSNFELIVNIKKPIIENRLANYQLNKNIKSFTVEPPNN